MSERPGMGARSSISLSGEVEGFERSTVWRVLTVWLSAVTGLVRAVLRGVFSLKSPATVSLENDQIRIVGHTEILGRTLREFDVRYPVANLTELRREARFPMLPVAASVCALFVGSTLGARYVIEGAGGRYWVMVALGLGLIAGGVFFDFVMRAVFPGVRGKTRLTLRTRDRRSVVLTGLDVNELDAMLSALDGTARAGTALKPLITHDAALSADTVKEPERAR